MIKYVLIFSSLVGLVIQSCSAQREVYEGKAYDYIKHSKVTNAFIQELYSSKPCTAVIETDTIKYPVKSDIEIVRLTEKVINTPYSCLCDILKVNYKFDGSCTEEIGLDRELAVKVSDSINIVYKNYKFVQEKIISNDITLLNKLGLSFSDIYNNSMLVTLGYHCSSKRASGKILSFYFLFDKNGNIQKVFHGQLYRN